LEATPSADFDKLIESGEAKEPDFFMKYYLDLKKQDEIIDEICKKHKLNSLEKRKVSIEIHLGSAPNSSKKSWLKERGKENVTDN
jgi:hypothetical protein